MAALGVPQGGRNKEDADRKKLRTDSSLRFEQLQSSIDTTFWQTLARIKIDEMKLSDSPIDVYGHFTGGMPHPKASIPPRIYLNNTSFENSNTKLSCLLFYFVFFQLSLHKTVPIKTKIKTKQII